MHPYLLSLIGGMIIGLAASLMLIFNGRVTGISGIYNGLLIHKGKEWVWRAAFIAGLFLGGFILNIFDSSLFFSSNSLSPTRLAIAGFLVGMGTVMGAGCTSGHGVCGLSRLSVRSLWATIVFMVTGILTASVVHYVQG